MADIRMTRWLLNILASIAITGVFFPAASAQEVFWQGEDSCGDLLDEPVAAIPGGFPLTTILSNGQAHYRLPLGGTLRLRLWKAESVPVQGKDYAEAYKNLVTQKPLQDDVSGRAGGEVVFALVESRYMLDLDYSHDPELSLFQLKKGGYTVNMNSKVKVIEWDGYKTADDASRRKWDKMTCESYHHELGHVLIGAQIFAEAEPLWMDLRGADEGMISWRTDDLFDRIMKSVRERQKKYHEEIDVMGRAVADSRPYVKLPFSWLD